MFCIAVLFCIGMAHLGRRLSRARALMGLVVRAALRATGWSCSRVQARRVLRVLAAVPLARANGIDLV